MGLRNQISKDLNATILSTFFTRKWLVKTVSNIVTVLQATFWLSYSSTVLLSDLCAAKKAISVKSLLISLFISKCSACPQLSHFRSIQNRGALQNFAMPSRINCYHLKYYFFSDYFVLRRWQECRNYWKKSPISLCTAKENMHDATCRTLVSMYHRNSAAYINNFL